MEDLESTRNTVAAMGTQVPIVLQPERLDKRVPQTAPVQLSHTANSALQTADGLELQRWDWHANERVTLIRPQQGWFRFDPRELYAYRDLFQFLVRREIKVRYSQSAIGVGWAILQPLFAMLVFTVIFGRLALVSSDNVPYALFSFAGLLPWMYFANGVNDGVNSLIANANMLSKVYFPRFFMPLAAVTARLVDFGVASGVMLMLLIWYGVPPTWNLLALPWVLAVMLMSTAGVALWLSTFAVQYRDVKHAMGFLIQILMYAAPVVYPASLIPARFQWLYAINPMVGVIESIRAAVLNSREMPWAILVLGTLTSLLVFVTGLLYFNRKQCLFADVV